MKSTLPLFIVAVSLLTVPGIGKDDTPVPPEVQKLVETMVAALKSGDDAALAACWHSAKVLGDVKAAAVAARSETEAELIDSVEQGNKEMARQSKNLQITLTRAAFARGVLSKYFGDISQLTMTRVELDLAKDAPEYLPRYDGVEIYLRAADGTNLEIGVDDLVRVSGVWKFQGQLEEHLTIVLPDTD
jgi:hypothetical protein